MIRQLASMSVFMVLGGACVYLVLFISAWNQSDSGFKILGSYANSTRSSVTGHQLCIIVPYRDRMEILKQFVPHMKKYLEKQNVANKILVIEQKDHLRFNRATLINIGFIQSEKAGCDYIVIHDVDLLPVDTRVPYEYPEKATGPVHLIGPKIHPRYSYTGFFGGIVLMKNEHFRKVNGMSNAFWGWGREDDEFCKRFKRRGIKITKPQNKLSGRKTFRHIHGKELERDTSQSQHRIYTFLMKRSLTVIGRNGLNSVKYKLDKKVEMNFANDTTATFYKVYLNCNTKATPWCVSAKHVHKLRGNIGNIIR